MPKKVFLAVILTTLLISFVSPQLAFSEKVNQPIKLKEGEIESLRNIIRKTPLTVAQRKLFDDAIHDKINAARKAGAVTLIKQVILNKQLNYWFREKPKEFSKNFLKVILKIGIIIATKGTYEVQDILNELERLSVKKASEYALNWLLRNNIEIGAGNASYSFESYKNIAQTIKIQYVILYHPLDNTHGMMIAEFYSKYPIEPPVGTDPNALGRPFDHPKSNPWPWDRWIENEKQRDNDGKLEPFIVRVKGNVVRISPPSISIIGIHNYATYQWDKTKGEPTVEVVFDHPVPEIEQSDVILAQSENEMKGQFIKEKILNPLLEKISAMGGSISDKLNKAKEVTGNLINKIKNLFASFKLGAQISLNLPSSNQFSASSSPQKQGSTNKTQPKQLLDKKIVNEINKIIKQITQTQKQGKNIISSADLPAKSQITLKELIERFDDISEKADVTIAQVQQYLLEHHKLALANQDQQNKQEKIKTPEKTEKESTQPTTTQPNICNLSDNQYPQRNKMIFNEIAWMGTTNSANDEWFELKDISKDLTPANLDGWQILDKSAISGNSGGIQIVLGNITSTPGKLLLFERTDDNSAPEIPADFIYKGSLANNNEALYLFDKNCVLQDKVTANPNWLAGSNSSKRTMERKYDLTWQTSRGIGGTPKASNSAGEIPHNNNSNITNNAASAFPSSQQQPQIIISYPQTSPVNKEIKVDLSADGLDNDSYDIKISIENASGTISEIFNNTSQEWQPSVYYLTNMFSGTSTQKSLRLRIKGNKNDFRGQANIVAKIRKNNSSKVFSTQNTIIIANPENIAPSAQFIFSPTTTETGEQIIFDASSSTDDGQITAYAWDFGDKSFVTTTLATTTHSFSTSGQFQITLQVTDNQGATSSTSSIVNITAKPKPKTAKHIVISEVQIKDKEFIELYNPGKTTSTAGWYLSYFPPTWDWNTPYKNIQFSTTTIASSSYFLIGLKSYSATSGYPTADWQISTTTIQLSNTSGAVGIFNCNPRIATTTTTTLNEAIEKSKSCKIDVFSWKKEGNLNNKVFEKSPLAFKNSELQEKSFQRKKINGNYIDSDNNSQDFEINYPKPTNSSGQTGNLRPPESVQNFQVASSTDNTVILTWSTSTDKDTSPENISYIIYWSRAGEITASTCEATTTSKTTVLATTTLAIKDLYYSSNYYFAIKAFDGLRYSALTTLQNPLQIGPETPIWEPYISRSTSFPGTETSTTKWTYTLANGFISSGPAIDQNGTIYFATTQGMVALNPQGLLKWEYPSTGSPSTPPLIDSDGTIYLGLNNGKIIAISPDGKLKEILVKEEFRQGGMTLDFLNNILYYTASQNDDKNKIGSLSLRALNFKDSGENWSYNLTEGDASTSCVVSPVSRPVISRDGKLYLGYATKCSFATSSTSSIPSIYFAKLISFDLKNKTKEWEKKIPLAEMCWVGNYHNPSSIVPSNQGVLYAVVRGTWETGGQNSYCADSLYGLNVNNINPTTTSISTTEAWKNYLGLKESSILLGKNQDHIYLSTENTNNENILYRISSNGTSTKLSVPPYFIPYLLDSQENIYGNNLASYHELLSLDAKGGERWKKAFKSFSDNFYPTAFSKDGTLYGGGWDTVGYRVFYAIGP